MFRLVKTFLRVVDKYSVLPTKIQLQKNSKRNCILLGSSE